MIITTQVSMTPWADNEAKALTAQTTIHTNQPPDAAAAAAALLERIVTSDAFARMFRDVAGTLDTTPGAAYFGGSPQAALEREMDTITADLHFAIIEAIRDLGLKLKENAELFVPIKAEVSKLLTAAGRYATHKAGKSAGFGDVLDLTSYLSSFKAPTEIEYAYSALASLYRLFEGACTVMERRGMRGYRLNPTYGQVREILTKRNKLPAPPEEAAAADRQAWGDLVGNHTGTGPYPHTYSTRRPVKSGDVVTLSPTAAALIEAGKTTGGIFCDILDERKSQRERGYDDEHDDELASNDWLAILTREAAEVAFLDSDDTDYHRALVKVAAVAVAALEARDREYGAPGERKE